MRHQTTPIAISGNLDGAPSTWRPDTPLAGLLIVFVLACTLGTTLARLPVPIYDDIAEAISWGQHFELGYYKHPPLFGWVAGLWLSVLPRNEFTAYLLGATNAGLGLLGVWYVAGRFLSAHCRLAATIVLALSPFWTLMATKFNANTVLLSIWPWATYAFIRTLETRALRHAIALGLLAAAALLSKYVSVMLLLSFGLAAILHPSRREYFRSPAPYIAAAVTVMALLPHIVWSYQHDFPTISYALSKTGGQPLLKQWKGFKAVLVTILLHLPMLLGVRIALGRSAWRALDAKTIFFPPKDRAWLIILAFFPLTLTSLVGLLGLVKVAENFFTPMIFLIPTALIASSPAAVARHRLDRSLRSAGGLLAAWVLCSPAIAIALMGGFDEYRHTPSREAARQALAMWREVVGDKAPVKIVAGSERYSLGLMFYIPGSHSEFTHFSYAQAPWVTPRRIERKGLLAVCIRNDGECHAHVENIGKGAAIRRDVVLSAKLLGWSGPPHELTIFIIPPRPAIGSPIQRWH